MQKIRKLSPEELLKQLKQQARVSRPKTVERSINCGIRTDDPRPAQLPAPVAPEEREPLRDDYRSYGCG